jgi:hypothetical protein
MRTWRASGEFIYFRAKENLRSMRLAGRDAVRSQQNHNKLIDHLEVVTPDAAKAPTLSQNYLRRSLYVASALPKHDWWKTLEIGFRPAS